MASPSRAHPSRQPYTPLVVSSTPFIPRRSARLRARSRGPVAVAIAEDSEHMAARNHSQQSQHPARSASALSTNAAAGATEPPLRRNLFHAHALQRPRAGGVASTGAASPASTASTAIVGGSGNGSVFGDEEVGRDARGLGGRGIESDDIVVRDKNGAACAVAIPNIAFAPGSAHDGEDGTPAADDGARGRETKLNELLARRPRQTASDQDILDALNTSLQNAVDSLAEDTWQFGRGT